ncbi:phosphoadenosine phosphosulfate reductase family protein [Zunongwangia sp. F363]|uniref:Phosphoadenosine phosphosulfate reductase family protein n=1 Tax=Autumnicola tepida TaxID=3075595 RepID=A0ABU3CBJ0_9FLAO|nr:phosphoadenosine phosphosulfate reductase family protein [Zunongwangia sp. F363]MDT0643706.1 phosphoadenosine phosphosulfate reductase family protein [Zunongwangia sp. F363]
MKLLVPLSGGKDSQATLLWAIAKYGVGNIIAVFCDVKWEHDWTYAHIQYLVEKTGVEFIVLSSEKYDGFIDMVKKKKRFPSSKARFCTVELKTKPMIDYILSLEDHVTIFQGIRNDESEERADMTEECRYFKYYFEPYKSNSILIEKYQNKPPKTPAQKKEFFEAKVRFFIDGKNDEKYHTYRKKEVFAWCEKYADDVRRPFIKATANDVILYSLKRDFVINPLYYKGFSRVGCFPCMYVNLDELAVILDHFPETFDDIEKYEKELKSTFFRPDKVPERYRSGYDPKTHKKLTIIRDVERYIKDKNAQTDLFTEPQYSKSCSSGYVVCE